MIARFRYWLGSPQGALWYFGISYTIIAIFWASGAFGAVSPDRERPSFRPQTAKEALQPKPQCMKPRLFILARRLPDGRAIAVMKMLVLVPCGK